MKKLLYIILLILPLVGCHKKWKKTSETTFELQVVKSKTSVSNIKVSEGALYLKEFTFTGVRKKGNDVDFMEVFSDNVTFDIATSQIDPILTYDIPQGDYTKINVNLRFEMNNTSESILVKGFFKDSTETDVPFIFQLENRVDINLIAASSTGSNITIQEEVNSHPVIVLNIIDWFEQLPPNLLQEADSEEVDGAEVVFINKSANSLLYALILDRIGQTATITF